MPVDLTTNIEEAEGRPSTRIGCTLWPDLVFMYRGMPGPNRRQDRHKWYFGLHVQQKHGEYAATPHQLEKKLERVPGPPRKRKRWACALCDEEFWYKEKTPGRPGPGSTLEGHVESKHPHFHEDWKVLIIDRPPVYTKQKTDNLGQKDQVEVDDGVNVNDERQHDAENDDIMRDEVADEVDV